MKRAASLYILEAALKTKGSARLSLLVSYDTLEALVHDVRVAKDTVALLIATEALKDDKIKRGIRTDIYYTALKKFKVEL